MGKPPKRLLYNTAELTTSPPATLPATQFIARIVSAAGKSLYTVSFPDNTTLLAELDAQFRNSIWMKKGGYVLVDTATFEGRDNKLGGQIVNVVREEREWRKMPWWPKEFAKKSSYPEDSDGEESTVGKMPPSDSEDEP